jgi:hypothetical protein
MNEFWRTDKRNVCVLLQPDDIVNVAIDKINSLLENFFGISDTELGKCSWNFLHASFLCAFSCPTISRNV